MEKSSSRSSSSGFLTLVGLLLVLVIIAFLCNFLLNYYFRNFPQPTLDKENKKILPKIDVATPNYQSTVDNTRKIIRDLNKKILEREKETER